MHAAAVDPTLVTQTIHCGLIADIQQRVDGVAECALRQGAPILLPAFLARYLVSGDEIQVPLGSNQVGTEIHVRKNAASRRIRELYQAPIAYVSQPKEDKRKELFVAAEVAHEDSAAQNLTPAHFVVRSD